MVDLIGNHFDLYRRNQAIIGVEVMGTLSLEERDERLKHHLVASKELHPALISPESEYKVLQRLMGGVLAVVLRPREAQCPLVRSIGRELLTCLVMQPVMNLASPGYINELIEYIFLHSKDDRGEEAGNYQPSSSSSHYHDLYNPIENRSTELSSTKNAAITNMRSDLTLTKVSNERGRVLEDSVHPRPADWARVLEAATQRRSEVLTPENLENMWTKGRNYKVKLDKNAKARPLPRSIMKTKGKPMLTTTSPGSSLGKEDKGEIVFEAYSSQNLNKVLVLEDSIQLVNENKSALKRSNSTSALKSQSDIEKTFTSNITGAIVSENFYSRDFGRYKDDPDVRSASDMVFRSEGLLHVSKLKCRVVGAYFEKTGSKSFAVYSIAMTDAENKTWFVKRRYRNFERLHRHLKDIPNYTLHLPPKRFLSSSIDDSFVHQRCIQLDRYLQDLLSIANIAEQHEVWDFLSVSSKSYSFGKSASVMKTLAVNVDDAMDDILRQFKGVSDGLMRKVVGSSSLPCEPSSMMGRNLSWNGDELSKHSSSYNDMETSNSLSDNEEADIDGGGHESEGKDPGVPVNGWHSDNELNSKNFPPRVIKRDDVNSPGTSGFMKDPVGMPPEWTPPNVSVPLLNLVDKIFQLNRRGWLRRQVFWISKQILQLMMEDAIDDWLLRQIHWLRRDDVVAQGINWIQNVLWPNGTFFLRLEASQSKMDDNIQDERRPRQNAGNMGCNPGSFELQLEAARRASDVKKILLGGAPTALVSLIGNKQYKRCAKDMYYFLQSSICVKQLAYGILELLLVTVFPELHDLVLDVHYKL
ncbi:hypothetical protein GIB67_019525 [Kingdonia uniflora]|uniref:Sorting nexin-16 n=1 Tax=Kingdonia uniflora TaxID=39325 RepID=A0A7J7N078_9MAGN|nr:hypothetical protein GIB67_019525 [Kingdonia uniflora]